jgi:hypothetical protein
MPFRLPIAVDLAREAVRTESAYGRLDAPTEAPTAPGGDARGRCVGVCRRGAASP